MKIKSKHTRLLLFLVAFGCSKIITAQSPLEMYIKEGLENNQQYLKELLDTKLAVEDNKIARSYLMPNVDFSAAYTLAGGGRNIDIPIGDLFNPAYAAINAINGNDDFPTDLANVSEQFLPNDFHETKVRISQPILNSNIYYSKKAAKQNISVFEAKQEAYKNQLVFQITKAYYDHLKVVEQKKVLDSTRVVLKESLRVNKKFVQYDVATKEVIYDAQAQLDQLDAEIATVKKNINTSKIFFNFLLNRNLISPIEIERSSSLVNEMFNQTELENTAVENRSEIQQLDAGIKAQELLIKRAKSFLIPEIGVGAEFGYQGFGYTFDSTQDYYLINFALTIPIFQGNRNKSNIAKERIKVQQLQADMTDLKNQIKLEAATAYFEYEEAIEVYNARLSELKNANENFKVVASKYRQNQVLLIQFNQARNELTSAQLQETIAKYNIKIAEANINKTIQNTL